MAATKPRPLGVRSHMTAIVYGLPGVGKTPFIARKRTLILNADGGAASAIGSGAQELAINTHADFTNAFEYLRHTKDHGFDWVWLDGWTIGQEKGLDDVMIRLVEEKSHRVRSRPDQGEYLTNYNFLKGWLRDMLTLPIHFGITAHTMPWIDEHEGDEWYVPAIPGRNMWTTVSGYFDEVLHLSHDEKRQWQLAMRTYESEASGFKFYARDRYATIPEGAKSPYLREPSLAKIEAAWKKKFGTVTSTPTGPTSAVRPVKKVAKKAAAPTRK